MKIIEGGEWEGLSKGSREVIRDKVAGAAKVKVRLIFGEGEEANKCIKAAARKFERALQKSKNLQSIDGGVDD